MVKTVKNDMRGEVVYLLLLMCSVFAGRISENLHRVGYVIIKMRSFESFMCLDLILER